MKRLRLDRWGGQLQPPRNPRTAVSPQPQFCLASESQQQQQQRSLSHCVSIHHQNQHASRRDRPNESHWKTHRREPVAHRRASTVATKIDDNGESLQDIPVKPQRNSPHPRQYPKSAKLAALHARLSLPARLPLATLARCLIDSTIDTRPGYTNAPLAQLGQDVLAYYTSEYLLCNYPRLPMAVLFAAQYAYVGPATLNSMRSEWGVEVVAAPGEEVDPGLLQLHRLQPGNALAPDGMHRVQDLRSPQRVGIGQRNEKWNYRRGMGMRIVQDDEFGDSPETHEPFPGAPISTSSESSESGELTSPDEPSTKEPSAKGTTVERASASFVRALTGALHLHAGAEASKAFHQAHVLSRQLQLEKMFNFPYPTRDLSILCRREGFEQPVARLISETGRLSRSPVFVVGIYSGSDRLGEGAGSSLNEARTRAAAAALRSWYLYSPPRSDIVLPSEVERSAFPTRTSKAWKPQMIDFGEIVT